MLLYLNLTVLLLSLNQAWVHKQGQFCLNGKTHGVSCHDPELEVEMFFELPSQNWRKGG